jgi:hypothetical protein
MVERCFELGINCVAVADHGTIEGAIKLKSMASFTVIVAEEILTPDGEIMGMFLKDTIPSGITVSEAISRIRDQNGLVCIPHPFDIFRPSALGGNILELISGKIDIIEVFNARTLPFQGQNKARSFAKNYNLAQSAGSDAHTLPEIGNAYVELPEFNQPSDFIQALAKGKIYGHKTNPLTHFISFKNRIKKRIG